MEMKTQSQLAISVVSWLSWRLRGRWTYPLSAGQYQECSPNAFAETLSW